jgi:DNA repair photolyase
MIDEKKLVITGLSTYYNEHERIRNEINPGGVVDIYQWNEASAKALIQAVAVMIETNNEALLEKFKNQSN